jgi:hypothetical protein
MGFRVAGGQAKGHIYRGRGVPRAVIRLAALLAVMLAGGLLVTASPALASSSLSWASTGAIDNTSTLQRVSCAPAGLCVAGDYAGNVVASNDPAGGASTWSEAHVDADAIAGVSCPSAGLCVAVDNAGDVLTSTDPAGGAGAWSLADVDGTRAFESVSCPSQSLCVATAAGGRVVTSTDPTGGAGAWHVTKITEGPLDNVSCPSVDLCVAVIEEGNEIMTSTEPSTPMPSAWIATDLPGEAKASGVSCSSAELCVIVGSDTVLSSTDPAGGTGAWALANVEGLGGLLGVSCEAAGLCVATTFGSPGAEGNVIATTDPTGGADAWIKGNVFGLPVKSPEGVIEIFLEDLKGVSCASQLCVVIDSNAALVGTPSATVPANSEGATSNTLSIPPEPAAGGGDSFGGGSSPGSGASGDSGGPGILAGIVNNTFVLDGVESMATRGTVKVELTLPGPGTLQIVGKATALQAVGASHTTKKRKATVVVGPSRVTVGDAGKIVLTLVPTASANTLLAKHSELTAIVTITYTPRGGLPRSLVRTVTFKRASQKRR